jgi:primosomal protein N'
MEDKQIQCRNCGKRFTFTANDQVFYVERRMSEPKRCKECRDTQKPGGSLRQQVARNLDALFKPDRTVKSSANDSDAPAKPVTKARKKESDQ